MRHEAIDFLIRSGIDVTETNISKVLKDGFSPRTPEFVLNEQDGLGLDSINSIYNFAVETMARIANERSRLETRAGSKLIDISNRFDSLNRRINEVTQQLRSAQVLEKNMSGYVETISLDLSDSSLVNRQNTTATLSDGFILGVVEDENLKAEMTDIPVLKYKASQVSSVIRGAGSIHPAKIEKITSGGIGRAPIESVMIPLGHYSLISEPFIECTQSGCTILDTENYTGYEMDGTGVVSVWKTIDEFLINSDTEFRITGSSEVGGARSLDIVIDRKSNELFSQIEVGLRKAAIATLYLSDDGRAYERVFDKPRYIKDTVFPVGNRSSRYIKISIGLNSHTSVAEGAYQYILDFKHLNILRSTYSTTAVFETNGIEVGGNSSCIAISTCDNFSDSNVSIKYQVSIDDGDWKTVRPVDKVKVGNVIEPVVLKFNDFSDNKLIAMRDFTPVNTGFESELEIPAQFLLSNDTRVFADDITTPGVEWRGDLILRTVYGYLKNETILDLGPTSVQLNGKWATGSTTLHPGLYEIRVREEDYANIYNANGAEVTDDGNGNYTVKDDQGSRTVSDPLFPNNNKIKIEKAFDLLFAKELIEKKDYTLYNNGSIYSLLTSKKYSEVIMSYRLHRTNADLIKIRAEMTSLDKTTIPYIERILIRMS